MKHLVYFIFLAIIPLLGHSQSKEGNLILWSPDASLKWSDFQGNADMAYGGTALTSGKILYSADYIDDSLTIVLECYFDKELSWLKNGDSTDYLLRHEQLHFDLFEAYARKMRKEMLGLDLTFDDAQKKLEKVFYSVYKECKDVQKQYDKDSNHSLIEEEQNKWDEKITKLLSEFEQYTFTSFRLPIN